MINKKKDKKKEIEMSIFEKFNRCVNKHYEKEIEINKHTS